MSFVDRRIRRSALRLLTPYGLRVTRVRAISGVVLVTMARLSGMSYIGGKISRTQIDDGHAVTMQFAKELHTADANE